MTETKTRTKARQYVIFHKPQGIGFLKKHIKTKNNRGFLFPAQGSSAASSGKRHVLRCIWGYYGLSQAFF
jgi:hypothetical protein